MAFNAQTPRGRAASALKARLGSEATEPRIVAVLNAITAHPWLAGDSTWWASLTPARLDGWIECTRRNHPYVQPATGICGIPGTGKGCGMPAQPPIHP